MSAMSNLKKWERLPNFMNRNLRLSNGEWDAEVEANGTLWLAFDPYNEIKIESLDRFLEQIEELEQVIENVRRGEETSPRSITSSDTAPENA